MTSEQMVCAEEFHQHEMNVGPTHWDRWVEKVEAQVAVFGVDIDGDRSKAALAESREDPCAIDELVDWFDAKWTVGRAVAEVHRRALAQVS
jgi:hypothetical protein